MGYPGSGWYSPSTGTVPTLRVVSGSGFGSVSPLSGPGSGFPTVVVSRLWFPHCSGGLAVYPHCNGGVPGCCVPGGGVGVRDRGFGDHGWA